MRRPPVGKMTTHHAPPPPALNAVFEELNANPPAILAKTAQKSGPAQANKQRIAIAFNKARRGRLGQTRPNPDPSVWSIGTMRNLDDHPPMMDASRR